MGTSALRVAIVGGGIGGLATANALIRQGIDVQVYEQAAELTEVGAGIGIFPNGLRVLRTLGIAEDIQNWGARWVRPEFWRWDGEFINPMWPPEKLSEIEVYSVHRADFLDRLAKGLPDGVVRTGHRAAGFEQNDDQATIAFENGNTATADVVIAADGIHSALQGFVVDPSPPIPSGQVAYRGVLDASGIDWPNGLMRNWLGNGKRFMVYPMRGGVLVNYVGFIATDEITKESWSAPGDPARLAKEFAGWDPLVEKVVARVETCFWWGLYDREPLATWTNGRLALLGDAAHPMLPHLGQGANQALEDAIALATVLAAADRSTAPRALEIYESVRKEHSAKVQAMTRANGNLYQASGGGSSDGDNKLGRQANDRAWIWRNDSQADATAALAATPLRAQAGPAGVP